MPSGTNNIPALAAVKSFTHQKQKENGSLCLISLPLEKREGNWAPWGGLGSVILSDQSASGLKQINVILQHHGKQGLPTVLCSIDTCVWLPARLGQGSTGSTLCLGGCFNPAPVQKYAAHKSKVASWAGAWERREKETADLVCPYKYTEEKRFVHFLPLLFKPTKLFCNRTI